MTPTNKGWSTLLHQWGKDTQLWLFIIAYLFLFRLILITTFSDQISDTSSLSDFAAVLWMGLRFDISTAAIWILLTFLLSISSSLLAISHWIDKLRHLIAYLYVVIATLLLGADIFYFRTYGDHFNQMIFGFIYDDTQAILITLWKEYPVIPFILATTLLIYLGIRLAKRWLHYTPPLTHKAIAITTAWWQRLLMVVLVLFCLLLAIRGGSVSGEPLLLKHAFVSADLFLNRTAPNPLTALRETVELQQQMSSSAGFKNYWPDNNPRTAIAAIRPDKRNASNLDEALRFEAKGASNPAKHIFVIINESHSGWTVHPSYREIGLSPNLSRMADEGIYFPNFLHSASGTIGSLNAVITGMPDTGLQVNYEPRSMKPYPTAIAENFRRMGYRTRFYYGGFISWQRIDAILKPQGFDEFYGGGNMSAGTQTNEWGVNDEHLFNFVAEKTDDDQPSFNVILTTTNHPPYDLDLEALGYPVQQLPEGITATKSETIKVLGHLWYSDIQIGKFVETIHSRYPGALFAITGDHTSRLQIQFSGDSVMEQYSVPFILYGPEYLKTMNVDTGVAGSHIDIPATLYELSAPKGFTYYSLGTSLLHKDSNAFSYGFGHIAQRNNIFRMGQKKPYGWPGQSPEGSEDPGKGVTEYRALRALSWHLIRRGSELQQ